MTNAESKFLRRILPHYFRHCASNPNTILTRFLGMYRVKLYHLRRNVKFVIMNSVFDTDKVLSSFYDLKGSVLGRDAKVGESVKKDNDLRRELPQSALRLQPDVRERLREQVRRDCNFLKDMKIMDYSMLVGIHYVPTKNSKVPKESIRGRTFRGASKSSYKLERSRSLGQTPNSVSARGSPTFGESTKDSHKRTRSELSPRLFGNFDKDNLHDRTTSEIFAITKDSPTQEGQNFSSSERKVEFTLKDNLFDLRVSKSDEKTPCNSCFPAFQSPVSPTDASIDESFVKPSDQSIISGSTLGFDIDDEASLLDFPKRTFPLKDSKLSGEEDWMTERVKIEQRRELAIEQNYWPFHRHFELNGDRRLVPMNASQLHLQEEARSSVQITNTLSCFGEEQVPQEISPPQDNLISEEFVHPISNRRDGGLTVDRAGSTFPLKVSVGGNVLQCDGKTFYMGIIDILQQFNVRKRFEARLRKIQGGNEGASCVHPNDYADRFVKFFDEYTANSALVPSPDDPGEEEVVFSDKIE